MMTTRRWLLVTVTTLALLVIAGRAVAGVYAEWAWYAAMRALPVYESKLAHELLLRGGAALGGFLLSFANLYAVRRSIVSLVLPRRLGNIDFGEEVPGRRLTGLVVIIAIVIASVLALSQDDWAGLALARSGVPFGERDPYQDRDLGFYVYSLPFERSLYLCSVFALLLVGAVVVFLYALTPSLRWERGRLHASTYVRRHVAVLGGVMLLVIGWSYRLESMTLLARGSGPLGAFTAFDDGILVPLLTGLSVVAYVTAPAVIWAGWYGHRRLLFGVFSALVLGGPVARLVLPLMDHWSTIAAARTARERPYVSTRTQFTRRAYGVDQIVDADSAGPPGMTRADLARGAASWDPPALLKSAELAHRDQSAIAIAWVPTEAGLTAVVALHPSAGAGPAISSTLDAVNAGAPGRASPSSAEPLGGNDRDLPAILVEPNAPAYAVVADSGDVLSAPSFASLGERLAHAWHLQNPRLLAMELPEPRPRIMLHRDVRERIHAIVPFFTTGPTLQSVLLDDALYWVAELFVTSDEYPLARGQLFSGAYRQYVRHAATAVVQAHTGRVLILADPQPDPMTRSWMRRFPGLFVTPDLLPAGFAALLPPAVDWGAAQAGAIARAGFPGAVLPSDRGAAAAEPLLELHELATRPYASRGTLGPLSATVGIVEAEERMIGAVTVRGGAQPRVEWRRVGSALSWHRLLDSLSTGPRRASAPGARRLSERKGEVAVLPTDGGIAFVQSWYSWPGDGQPSLSSVVLLEGAASRVGGTLSEALGFPSTSLELGGTAWRAGAAALYQQMSAAMKRGDWRAFGAAYAALGRLLRSTP